MKFLLYILIPFYTIGQTQKVSDALHFYGTVAVCETAYHSTKGKKPYKKFLAGITAGLAVGAGKEVFDANRCNRNKRTGFSKLDLGTDAWACLCWVPFRICLNDWNKRKRERNFDKSKRVF